MFSFLNKRPALPKLPFYWRSFLFLLTGMAIVFALLTQGLRFLQGFPRAHAVADQLVNSVNLSRSALIYAEIHTRKQLIRDLNAGEKIQVYLREPTDEIVALPDDSVNNWLSEGVREDLGRRTKLAQSVNQESGIWVSFEIADDQYWLRANRNRSDARQSQQGYIWAFASIVVAFFGALWITLRYAKPLQRLAESAQNYATGQAYEPVPQGGAAEVAHVAMHHNAMLARVNAHESERNLMLASLSHDLRTPLARLRLEIEMAGLKPLVKAAMEEDIAQLDMQLRQFMDYSRSHSTQPAQPFAAIDIAALLVARVQRWQNDPRGTVSLHIAENWAIGLHLADKVLLIRALDNLIDNALKYGTQEENTPSEVSVSLRLEGSTAQRKIKIMVSDTGAGIPEGLLERVKKPFTRANEARTQADGSGLGLAIVEKIAQLHGGSLRLENKKPHGLNATFLLNCFP